MIRIDMDFIISSLNSLSVKMGKKTCKPDSRPTPVKKTVILCMHIHGVGYDTRDAYKQRIIYAQLPNTWGDNRRTLKLGEEGNKATYKNIPAM